MQTTIRDLADREEAARKRRLEIIDSNRWRSAVKPESYFPGYEQENRIALSAPWNDNNEDDEK